MSVQQIEVVIRRSGQPERRVILSSGVTQLGRAEDNDLVLPDIGVSRRHARIVVDGGSVRIDDLGSGNGTIYRGRRVESQTLADGDEVVIDPFVLMFRMIGAAEAPPDDDDTVRAPPDAGFSGAGARLVVLAGHRLAASYPIGGAPLSLGRSEARDVVLFDPAASRDHARVELRADGYWLVDRGSANGTYVDEQRVQGEVPLRQGSQLRIGATEFRFELAAPSAAPPAPAPPPFTPPPAPPPYTPPPPPPNAPTEPAWAPPPPPPAPAPAPVASAPPPAAPQPQPRRSNLVPVLIAVALGFFLVLAVVAAAVVGVALVKGGALPEPLGLSEPKPDLPPPYAVRPENREEVDRLMADGAMHAAQGRFLEAAGRYYKVTKTYEPAHPEATRAGHVVCELVAFDVLEDALLSSSLDDKGRRSLKQEAERAARAAEGKPEALVEARAQLERALVVLPGDADLTRALQAVRAGLTSALATDDGKALQKAVAAGVADGETAFSGRDYTAAAAAFQRAVEADPHGLTPARYRAEERLRAASYRLDHP